MGSRTVFIQQHVIPWVFYFALIALVRFRIDLSLLTWCMGGVLAVGFIVFERLLHFLWLHPELAQSKRLKELLQARQFVPLFRYLISHDLQVSRLLGLSVLFLGSWMVLAAFIVSSSASFMAKGLVMGIGLRPVLLILWHWRQPREIAEHLLWQVKRELSDTEIRVLSGCFMALFGLLSLWLMVS